MSKKNQIKFLDGPRNFDGGKRRFLEVNPGYEIYRN